MMTENQDTIVFFWIGEEIETPRYLVKSIRLTMGDKIKIVQLTNHKTKDVEGVSSIQRYNLSNQIMVARLEAYSNYIPETENTYFCDADSIFINKVSLPNSSYKIYLCPREINFNISHTFPEFYEEFVGKTAMDVMPYLFGMIATKGNQQSFFKSLYKVCLKLPERFHRWYGDQYSLKSLIDNDFHQFEKLRLDKYLVILKEPLTIKYLEKIHKKGSIFITFKGPNSKAFLKNALLLYEFYYKKIN